MHRPAPLLLTGAFALLTLIWGTTWAVIRIGLEGIPPFAGVALRFAIASALLLILGLATGVRFGRGRHEVGLWFANALLSFCTSYGVVYWVEQWVPSGLNSVLFATFPLFVAVLAHFALPGERLTLLSVIGILLGFGGVAVIFSEDFARLGGSRVAFAAVVMLVSPLVSSLATVAVKRWGREIHPVSLTAVPMGMASVIMGSLSLVLERDAEFSFDVTSVGALAYLAVFGSAVTFTLYFWMLRHVAATRLSMIAYLVPLMAVGIGTTVLDEPLTARTIAGSLLVVLGVALTVRYSRREKAQPRAEGDGE